MTLQVQPLRAFHIMTKPVGPICNLDCKYCFYLEKKEIYGEGTKWRMSDAVLEEYIRQYIAAQQVPEVSFAWQGGEPTLLGVGFFQKVVELQKKHAGGKKIVNAIQTNGTLLDDDWGKFLHEHEFLVGLSIDGPRELHDHYRVDRGGKPTFEAVLGGLEMLKKHRVEFNTLTVIHRENAKHPVEVYRFLKSIGSQFHQFIPLVERIGVDGKALTEPPIPGRVQLGATVAPWCPDPKDYGRFLIGVFDEWVRRDVGRVFVQLFDIALGAWMGMPPGLCVFAPRCGTAMAMEHNGDVYSCDHYVYPRYRLGNVMSHPLPVLAESEQQRGFGEAKSSTLPKYCVECPVRFACNGDCPKHRFAVTPDGEAGLSYLCPGYRAFFQHVDPYMKKMAELLRARRPAAEIMLMLNQQSGARAGQVGRNDACPCGSGKKYKKCCGAA